MSAVVGREAVALTKYTASLGDEVPCRYQTNLKGVCVCNATQCDTVSNDYKTLTEGQVGVYTSSNAGDRFAYKVVNVDATAATDGTGPEKGLQYSLGRVTSGSTDVSTSIYSYNDNPGDLAQAKFSIDVDRKSNKIDLIQRALRTSTRDVKLYASSWAPPAWMTTENTTINCAVKGKPGEAYWKSLALYYSKFFDAYKTEGIEFWAMTVQNEPTKSILQTSAWQSLRMSAEVQRDFVKLDLGPTMAQSHPDLKIIAGDDQKSGILDELAPFQDPESLQYISGLGVHWTSTTLWSAGPTGTWLWIPREAPTGPRTSWTRPSWWTKRAAPSSTSKPMFYVMGHLSKFVPAGSRRVDFPKSKTLSNFHRTAFVTPDKNVVLQFLNRDNSDVTVSVKQTDAKTFTLQLPAHSMQTVILPASSATKIQS
ncbi:glucosylceramidase, putative [Phytophthora infestans T30-4]|uniref:Glucosylceramidase, putative n=1 Tax=Phytophthora infestans (strain T30-4) TaxID=403677 RepID=D0N0V2_PHYIT|nr:glucosylceramidase, putative [Phytophthora infestans T30-4]EEY67265.1 glucosylceramidase, putative [Phytophthora infestans T30-4]|eukprot:XP_002905913.1 glucosylceramidase, putative [Phytophthora infestans T30-4]